MVDAILRESMHMKKVVRVLLGFTIAGLLYAPSRASDFSLFGAYWNTRDFNAGVGGGLKWAPSLGATKAAFELKGTYFDDIKVDPADSFDFKVRVIPVEVGFKYDFMKTEKVNLYLGAGGGYYFLDTNEGQLDDDFGYYGEIGVQFGESKGINFFVEGIYRGTKGTVKGVQSPGNPTVTEDVSIDLSGAAANMGVAWRW